MYNVIRPKIHLSIVLGYDLKDKKLYISDDDRVFDDISELITFLAGANKPVLNWVGTPIPGMYKNEYMDNQALDGLARKGFYDEVPGMSRKRSYEYKSLDDDWKVNKYLFWIDIPGSPNFDVRLLKPEVNAEYEKILNNNLSLKSPDWYKMFDWYKSFKRRMTRRQGRSRHKNYPWRCDARYIHRARAAYGMEAEEEYKEFVKKKDKDFKSIWPDEDFGGYHSTGWKDNSGNRYKHQWETKAKRDFEKMRKKKDAAMFSGGKIDGRKVRRSKEELEEELEMLRTEFGC